MASPEGDPGKLKYFHDARWTTNYPLPIGEKLKMFPGTCERCVFGRGEHSAECEDRVWLEASARDLAADIAREEAEP